MDNSTYIALSGAMAQRRALDIVSNNVANMNTSGFKAELAAVEEFKARPPGGASQSTSFVLDRASYLDASQGTMQSTGNPLDVALNGAGWLSYEMPNGERAFGRDGSLVVDADGGLMTKSGNRVLNAGGTPIDLPEGIGEINISSTGEISGANGQVVDIIGVFNVENIGAYNRLGAGMFVPPQAGDLAGVSVAQGVEVAQGFLEGSNINAISEMTRMIEVQRAYERSSKVMDKIDQARNEITDRIGRIR